MVSPVQFNNSQRVYFRGSDEDLINAPGAFEQQATPETQEDEFVSSAQPEVEEKSSVGKKIAKFVGGLIVAAAALFTAYKWKGDTWLNKEAQGTTAKIKNWLMKPGEWMENTFKSLKTKLGFGKKVEGKDTKPAETTTETPAGTTAETTGETPAGTSGETPAKKTAETTGETPAEKPVETPEDKA